MKIPENYARRMQELLGEEYEAYLKTLEEERAASYRVNTGKCSVAEGIRYMNLPNAAPVPWVPEGVYYPPSERPAKSVPWHAGLIYIQEASAMTPGSVIPIQEGDRVLDLCAAPGGKSTQVAARLRGTGVLYSNDISASRAQALLKNLEMSGTGRIFVTAESPAKLMDRFPAYFDAILVDAPCSGEGMIRKDASMFQDWLAKGPSFYQPIQYEILEQARTMLAPGGHLLYSTCTFSREEDEDNISAFLEAYPDMELVEIPLREGFSRGLIPGTVRLWPHHTRGEGHFVALLHRKGEKPQRCAATLADTAFSTNSSLSESLDDHNNHRKRGRGNREERSRGRGDGRDSRRKGSDRRGSREASDVPHIFPWMNEAADLLKDTIILEQMNRMYAIPAGEQILPGIHYLRTGLLLGEWKNDRFIPSQALAMALDGAKFPNRITLSMEDPRLVRYLKGETIQAEEEEIHGEEGWVLVCADRFPLGWAQRKGTNLKNKYYPGWRWQ